MSSNVFRFNVLDDATSTSFVGPAHGLKVLAAACSRGAASVSELLANASRYDPEWIEEVRLGLMIFDEHNIESLTDSYAPLVVSEDDREHRAFRIIDATTRARSMVPAQLGLVVVNLAGQRIIQIQNNYAELHRKGRGRVRSRGNPTQILFHYELPETWSIVP